jgi:hypothetical protein
MIQSLSARLHRWSVIARESESDVWPFLLIGAVLYVLRLGAAPLWYDEAVSEWMAELPLARMIAATAGDTHPPLYYAMLHVVQGIGNSPFVLRLPSVFAALVVIYLAWEIAREFKFNRTTQIIGVGLLLVIPFQLWFAQEARMYTIFQASVLGALLAALRRRWLWFVALNALALWTHNYGLFYLVVNCGVAAWVIARDRFGYWQRSSAATAARFSIPISNPVEDKKHAAIEAVLLSGIVGGAALLLWSPWVLALRTQMGIVNTGYWIQPVTAGDVVFSLFTLLFGATSAIPIWLMPICALFSIGLLAWLLFKIAQRPEPGVLIGLWFVAAPIVAALIISVVWRPVFLFRGFAPGVPIVCLLVGWAVEQLNLRYRLYAAILIVPLIVGAGIWHYVSMPEIKGSELQTIMDHIREQWQPGDVIFYSNEGPMVAWHMRSVGLDQYLLPRCPRNDLGALSQQTRDGLGMREAVPEALAWKRAWFVYTVMSPVTKCAADEGMAFLLDHPHKIAFEIQNDQYVEANVWLLER